MYRRKVTFQPNGPLTPDLAPCAERMLETDNLTMAILHAHLLIERAMMGRIKERKPNASMTETYGYAKKMNLFITLYWPRPEIVEKLNNLNELRNEIAHDIVDEEAAVHKWLPWPHQGKKPDALNLVKSAFGEIAMFGVGAVKRLEKIIPPET